MSATRELKSSLMVKSPLYSYWVNPTWVSTHGLLRNAPPSISTTVVKTVASTAELLKNNFAMLLVGNAAPPTLLWIVVLKLSLLLMITLTRLIFSKDWELSPELDLDSKTSVFMIPSISEESSLLMVKSKCVMAYLTITLKIWLKPSWTKTLSTKMFWLLVVVISRSLTNSSMNILLLKRSLSVKSIPL